MAAAEDLVWEARRAGTPWWGATRPVGRVLESVDEVGRWVSVGEMGATRPVGRVLAGVGEAMGNRKGLSHARGSKAL